MTITQTIDSRVEGLRHACRQEEDTAAGSASNLRIQQVIGKNWGIHCKKEIVILTKELLFEFQTRVTNVFSTFLKYSLTKECWNTLVIHYLAPCYHMLGQGVLQNTLTRLGKGVLQKHINKAWSGSALKHINKAWSGSASKTH